MGESGIFRFRNWVLNMNQVVRMEYCSKQIYVLYATGDEQIVKDPEVCAAFAEYMGGVFPDMVNSTDRSMAIHIASVARRKIYAEARIIEQKLVAMDGGVEFQTGPGFAGHQAHKPITAGGDPATSPSVRQPFPTNPPGPSRKKPCCGKGRGKGDGQS